MTRGFEELFLCPFLDHTSINDEDDSIGDLPGKAYLVGSYGHLYSLSAKTLHDLQDLFHHLRLQSQRSIIKQHRPGLHGKSTGDSNSLFLSPGELIRKGIPFLGNPDFFLQSR